MEFQVRYFFLSKYLGLATDIRDWQKRHIFFFFFFLNLLYLEAMNVQLASEDSGLCL